MMRIVRSLYDWTLRLAAHRHATLALAGVSFIESSAFPIPPDVMLIPMCLANRDRAFQYAAVCTAASVLGGIAGYFIGYALYETVGKPIVAFYGATAQFETFQGWYKDWGFWIVLLGGLTPFPYKIITIASGVAQMNLPAFIVFSILARGMRFYLLAGLIRKFGVPIQAFIEKYMGWLTILFFVLLIGGFAVLKYIV